MIEMKNIGNNDSNTKTISITHLPDEIIYKILHKLGFKQWLIMSEVSKQFNNLAYDNALWKKYFPSTPNAPSSFYDQAKIHYRLGLNLSGGYTKFFQSLAAVKKDGCALEYASDELRNNPEFMLDAVKQNGWALQYASYALKGNPEIVMAAVKDRSRALRYASAALKDNQEIVMAAVKRRAFSYILCKIVQPFLKNIT